MTHLEDEGSLSEWSVGMFWWGWGLFGVASALNPYPAGDAGRGREGPVLLDPRGNSSGGGGELSSSTSSVPTKKWNGVLQQRADEKIKGRIPISYGSLVGAQAQVVSYIFDSRFWNANPDKLRDI